MRGGPLGIFIFRHLEFEVNDFIVALRSTVSMIKPLLLSRETHLISVFPPVLPIHPTRVHVNPLVASTTQALPDDAVAHLEAPLDRQIECLSRLRVDPMVVILVVPVPRVLHVQPATRLAQAAETFQLAFCAAFVLGSVGVIG